MAKKKTEEPTAESTAVALIPIDFPTPEALVLVSKADYLATIKAKAIDYAKLTIKDTTDKEGYEAVVKAMGEMKQTRLAFMNAAEANAIGPYKAALKKFLEDVAEVETALKAEEALLRAKKDFTDGEKARLKADAEAKKVQAMAVRVNDLNLLGAAFDGKVYTFPYSQLIMIPASDVKELTDENFTELMDKVLVAYDAEQERLNNKKAAEALEVERQRLLAIQNEKDAQALNERRTKIRLKELKMLGYQHDGVEDIYFNDVIPIQITLKRIDEDSDEIWDELIYDLEHFVVATEPLVVSIEEIANEVSANPPENDYSGVYATAKSFSETNPSVVEPLGQASDANPAFNEPETDNPLTVELPMDFSILTSYTDCDISAKMKMRVFPEEYKELALAGIDVIANEGKFQDLNWIIMPK